jgi:LacI family transcriptional regulator
VPNTSVHDARVNYLRDRGYPFLAYGRTHDCSGYSWFDFDNEAGSQLAVRHLAALGHRAVAYVHSPLALNFASQRYQGFLLGLQEAGLGLDPGWLAGPATDRRSGHDAVQALMALPNPPTAIVVDNNLGGIGVLRGLLNMGLVLGRDVSVVVHGVIPADSLLAGLDITMVTQPTAQSTGETMAEMVLQVLREPGRGPFQLLRQPELVLGQTTGCKG